MQGKEMMSKTQQSPPPPNQKYIGSLWSYSLKTLLFLETLDSSHAMVLLPLACEPLEYLRGRFSNEERHQDRVCRTFFYKITEIVRALWLAERSVCMRVCKQCCGVKLFGFSRANHASTNLKKFSSSKLDKFTLFTHSFVGWNLENRYKKRWVNFSSLKLTF